MKITAWWILLDGHMAVNDWWAADQAARFWMETTDRANLGVDRGYTLVSERRPGDVAFHWHKSMIGRPALVGWSTITGPLSVDPDYSWMPQVTRGRVRGRPTVGRVWRMKCGGFHALDQPIDRGVLTDREGHRRAVYHGLKDGTSVVARVRL
jgi:hypothetical protein